MKRVRQCTCWKTCPSPLIVATSRIALISKLETSAKLLYCPCIEAFMTLRKGNAVHCRNPGGWL